jgi:hypothetical protein
VLGETESEKSGVAEDEGEPVLELPDFEPPQDVRSTIQHDRRRKRVREREPTSKDL